MPEITVHGNIAWGLPLLTYYSQPGLAWCTQEIKEARALYVPAHSVPNDHTCNYCERLLDIHNFEQLTHQPGYRALCESALRCSLCFTLLVSLDVNLPRCVEQEDATDDTDFPSLHDVVEMIELIGLPKGSTTKHNFQRFMVVWSSSSFHWVGQTIGIYKYLTKDPPADAIWTGSDGENFDARLPTMSDWLQNCVDHHECCSRVTTPNLPTRILDLDPPGSTSSVRLIRSAGHRADYATLSHCWGGATPLTTTKATLLSREQQIKMSALPRTFQEAVQIVKTLGLRYLWIDTLCIVQDDAVDWMQESAKMSQVYHDAYVSIAASAATNCNAGLIHRFVSTSQSTYGSRSECSFAVRIASHHSRHKTTSLETRAWALQEDLLAHRVIYFGERQLLWHCRAVTMSEDGLLDGLEHERYRATRLRSRVINLAGTARDEVYQIWRRLAEEFARRRLTHESDKLPALAGITAHFQDVLRDEPFLGLWRDKFVVGLLWQTDLNATKSKVLHIPSWSWLSTNDGIIYDQIWPSFDSDMKDYYMDPVLEVCYTDLKWSATPLTSVLESSKLVVRGMLLPVTLSCHPSNHPPYHLKYVEVIPEMGVNPTRNGSRVLDVIFNPLPSDIQCLHVANITSFDLKRNSSLNGTYIVMLLRSMQHMSDAYVRVGIGTLASHTKEDAARIVDFKEAFPEAVEATLSLH